MPLAVRLGVSIQAVDDLRERELGYLSTGDIEGVVRATWEDRLWAFPGGESNAAAQRRGAAAIREVVDRHPAQQVVVGTHGNLLALILQQFDPSVGFSFWQALTMPDVYRLEMEAGHAEFWRLW